MVAASEEEVVGVAEEEEKALTWYAAAVAADKYGYVDVAVVVVEVHSEICILSAVY